MYTPYEKESNNQETFINKNMFNLSSDEFEEVILDNPTEERNLSNPNNEVENEEIIIDSAALEKRSLISEENGLEALYDHFVKEKHGDPIPFNKGSKVGLFLELLGGTGGIYAWPAAKEYAKNMAPWLTYSFAIANPISNALFLIKATDDLIDTIQSEAKVPEEIAALVDSPTKKSLIAKYIKMGLGSLVCVVPFSIAVYLFPIPNCDTAWCLGLTVSHSTLSNTILHGISWGLILTPKYWYYRLPILPFEKLYSHIKNSFSTPTEIELLRLIKEQQVIQTKYKDHLVNLFKSSAQELVKQKDTSLTIENEQDSSIHEGNISPLRVIQEDNASLIKFVELAQKNNPLLPPILVQRSYLGSLVHKVHGFLSNGGISVVGAGIMVAGCIGWIANPIYIGIMEGLNLPLSISIGSLPLYSTAVLCAFYGTGISNQIYNYLTTWTGSFRDKLSPEIIMYPKTFALFSLVNIYISFFAFATGSQLINTIFADKMWDGIRPVLEKICMPTLQILSFIPLTELFNLVVRKLQAKFGSLANDDTFAARLLVKMPVFAYYLQQMKGDELMCSINKYSPEQQRSLGIEPEQFRDDFKIFSKLQRKIEELKKGSSLDIEKPSKLNRNSFFGSGEKLKMNDKTPLLTLTNVPSYNN